jgi:DNA-binding response OmpR family regulator/serine phosphatase RsbU (regulator of sigma subunit)/anti-sigma regulatory factor (Ser/Thr protein kinase)
VLVVDDNADMRDYLARLLGDRFDTETAADGVGALEAIASQRPDLVLTDVMMPAMDGFGLLKAIRDDPRTARLPVIMLTARAGQESSVDGIEAGADDYLVKPFSQVELLARVRSNLEAARAREEVTEQAVSRARRLDRLVLASVRIDARLETLGVLEQLAQEARELFRAVSVTAEDGAGNHRTAGEQQELPNEHVEPLVATAGGATGALRIALAPGGRFDAEDRAICAQLALVGAGALQRASMHAAERDTVQRLQASLLPQHLPVVPGLQLAVRYLPASASAAGGDWYDVVTLPRGWLGVVVGDVVGHGLEAAATMSYLRNVLRAYLLEGNTPGSALMRMHTLIDRAEAGFTATLSCLTIDPVTGVGWIASAGHPAPLRITAAGGSEYLDTGAGRQPALGVGAPPEPAEQQIALTPGETLLLYSDGLVEPRDGSDGMERLALLAMSPREDLDVYCDALIDRLAPRSARRDDVALLALRRSAPSESVLELRPPATRGAGAHVRARLRPWLQSRSFDPPTIQDALLAVSEAVANAIEHSGISSAQDLSVRARVSEGRLRVTVRDSGRWRAPHDEPMRGYGLSLMQALSERVSIDRRDDGTRVELVCAGKAH